MIYRVKDKRTKEGKVSESFVNRIHPKAFAEMVKMYVFPKAPVPSVVYVILRDNEVEATKTFVGGLFDYHTTSTIFKDFETTGDFSGIIEPKMHEFKLMIFGKEYEDAYNKHKTLKNGKEME